MQSNLISRIAAAGLATTLAMSLVVPAFAAPLPVIPAIPAQSASQPNLTPVEYRRENAYGYGRGRRYHAQRYYGGRNYGGALALGVLGLGAAAILGAPRYNRDDYYDYGYRPYYGPRYGYDGGYRYRYDYGY